MKHIVLSAILMLSLLVFTGSGKNAAESGEDRLVVSGAEGHKINGAYAKDGNHTSGDCYRAEGAGKAEANGIYHPFGKHETGGVQYTNGHFILYYKGCNSKWMIIDGDRNLYKNRTDSETPPPDNWEAGCGEENLDPAPTIRRLQKPCFTYSQ